MQQISLCNEGGCLDILADAHIFFFCAEIKFTLVKMSSSQSLWILEFSWLWRLMDPCLLHHLPRSPPGSAYPYFSGPPRMMKKSLSGSSPAPNLHSHIRGLQGCLCFPDMCADTSARSWRPSVGCITTPLKLYCIFLSFFFYIYSTPAMALQLQNFYMCPKWKFYIYYNKISPTDVLNKVFISS